MSKKATIILNPAGIRALLRSTEMQGVCSEKANKIAQIASSGGRNYVVSEMVGSTRAKATVKAGDAHAYYSNLKYNTIEKAVSTAREV